MGLRRNAINVDGMAVLLGFLHKAARQINQSIMSLAAELSQVPGCGNSDKNGENQSLWDTTLHNQTLVDKKKMKWSKSQASVGTFDEHVEPRPPL